VTLYQNVLCPTILFGQRNVECPRKETGNLTGSSICYEQNTRINSIEFSVLQQQALCLKQFIFMYNIFLIFAGQKVKLEEETELPDYWN
jgi:hypothetical protein